MEKGISGKIVSGFVNILFLIFEKGDKQKNCARFFKIYKYTCNVWKRGKAKKLCQDL